MRQHILKALLKSTYQSPESVRNRINARVDKWYYVDTISRELRKLRAMGKVESEWFENRSGKGRYLKWRLTEEKSC